VRNKFYMVSDSQDDEPACNIVIASNSREAKVIGAYAENTENLENWTDLRVLAIKGRNCFWIGEDDDRIEFSVSGEEFVYTDLKPQLDSDWGLFIEELKKQGRFKETK